jgi:hypothetical protein
MMTKPRFTVIAVGVRAAGSLLLLTLAGSPVGADTTIIKTADLKPLFSDSDIHLDMTRRSSHGWSNALWKFSANGSLSGYLFTSAYTAQQRPENALDSGKWWVSQNRVCLQWRTWDGGQERCYRITTRAGGYTASGVSGLFSGRFTLVRRHTTSI